jgi:hypothetical protein
VNEAAPLQVWESFYVIVGSSAGALTGLQFVVMTLVAEGRTPGSKETLSAFGTPNVVHFCAALLVSAIFSAPWSALGPPGVAAALLGVSGFLYSVAVLRRSLRQRDYKPVLEDWIWHAALPMLAYAALVHSGMMLSREHVDTLYVVAGAALLLVFIGIHNAWDTVTYIVMQGLKKRDPPTLPAPVAPAPPAPTYMPPRAQASPAAEVQAAPPPATPPPATPPKN